MPFLRDDVARRRRASPGAPCERPVPRSVSRGAAPSGRHRTPRPDAHRPRGARTPRVQSRDPAAEYVSWDGRAIGSVAEHLGTRPFQTPDHVPRHASSLTSPSTAPDSRAFSFRSTCYRRTTASRRPVADGGQSAPARRVWCGPYRAGGAADAPLDCSRGRLRVRCADDGTGVQHGTLLRTRGDPRCDGRVARLRPMARRQATGAVAASRRDRSRASSSRRFCALARDHCRRTAVRTVRERLRHVRCWPPAPDPSAPRPPACNYNNLRFGSPFGTRTGV